MDGWIFLRGLAMGFALAAPVGPIAILCIQRTLAGGVGLGLASGLGAATADAAYGLVAALGVAWVSNVIVERHIWFSLAGGAFLTYIGVRTFLAQPSATPCPITGRGLLGAYVSTLLLTLSNPMTVVTFAGIFAATGLVGVPDNLRGIASLVAGVFTGSAVWWAILSHGVGFMRGRFDARAQRWVNRVSGLAILVSAAVVLSGRW